MATNTVCSGEILQTQHRRDFQFTREKYFKVLEMKTAELFALSCELSGLLSGASVETRNALRQFGLAFGTAYQVYDDCVDLFGSETRAGKSLGTDLAKGKLTLPVLLAWERANAEDRASLQGLIQTWESGGLRKMGELLVKYDTLASSLQVIEDYLKRSREILGQLRDSGGRDGLWALTGYLARQAESLGSSVGT
jgi:octaprenyl-diphosphate synthase